MEPREFIWGDENILCLDLCGGHFGVYMGKKSLTGAFKIHIFKPMQIIFQ